MIGKSGWIYYALRRRLAERKPVIWYREQACYLFVEEGVYKAPPQFPPSSFNTVVWTLVDSDESKEGPPPLLVDHETSLFVIYITSPASERWSRMHKTVSVSIVVMNPWTRWEIHQAYVFCVLYDVMLTHPQCAQCTTATLQSQHSAYQ